MATYLRNIVIEGPDERALASFYAALLGMRIIREDWLVIGQDAQSLPRLAFDPVPDYRAPRWPDPEYPQQLHLDILVPDLAAAEHLARELGATPLQHRGTFVSYADPAGHPFCLYPDPDPPAAAAGRSPATGRLGSVIFDCLSPRALATFYQELLGIPARLEDTPGRVRLAPTGSPSGPGQPALGFQHAQSRPPRWPDPKYPQQLHLDIHVDNSAASQELARRLGAIRLPDLGGSCPVYADPAGHPFCLCAARQ